MGDIVGIGGKLVNPMATTVLTLTVDDQNHVNLQSALPPNMTIKVLQGIVTDIIMNTIETQMSTSKPLA